MRPRPSPAANIIAIHDGVEKSGRLSSGPSRTRPTGETATTMQNTSAAIAISTKPQPKLRITQSRTESITLDRLSVPITPQRTNAVDNPTDPQNTRGSTPLVSRCMSPPGPTPRGDISRPAVDVKPARFTPSNCDR